MAIVYKTASTIIIYQTASAAIVDQKSFIEACDK